MTESTILEILEFLFVATVRHSLQAVSALTLIATSISVLDDTNIFVPTRMPLLIPKNGSIVKFGGVICVSMGNMCFDIIIVTFLNS